VLLRINFAKRLYFAVGTIFICAAAAVHADLDGGTAPRFFATATAKMGDVGGRFFGKVPDPARTHHYYIATEYETWDYAPEGRDVVCGNTLPPAVVKERATIKTRYVQYTDGTFQIKARKCPSLGILGPVLRGKVGDFIAVTFLNRTQRPLSIHPHGVKYDKESEGSFYLPAPGLGAAVGQGAKFTYVWQLDEASGPKPDEPSSKAWLYHSHVSGDREIQRGLIGCIIVTDPKRSRSDGTPDDVDREFATLYMIFDESGLSAEDVEEAEYASARTQNPPGVDWAKTQQLTEQGARYTINGMIYGNLPGLEMNEGERVRWYLFGLGSEQDFHTAHWHGLRVTEEGRRRTDVVELLPASMKVADMVADNPGSWLMHCHVAEHMKDGMFARLRIFPQQSPRASQSAFFGVGAAIQELQVTRAIHHANGELILEGSAVVPEAFSVADIPVSINVARKTFSFHLDDRGAGTQSVSSFHVRNAGRFGLIRGGLVEFDAALAVPELMESLPQPPIEERKSKNVFLPITVRLDSIQYECSAALISTGSN
jgi:hypothetical protein